jgi:hypothetical protein
LPDPLFAPASSSGLTRDDVRCPASIIPSLRSCIDIGLEIPVKLHDVEGIVSPTFLGGAPRDRMWLMEVAAEEGVKSMESGLL